MLAWWRSVALLSTSMTALLSYSRRDLGFGWWGERWGGLLIIMKSCAVYPPLAPTNEARADEGVQAALQKREDGAIYLG